jgi:hypothetical protein
MTHTFKAHSLGSADMTTKAEAAKVFKREARRILKQWAQDSSAPVPHPAFQHHLVSARDRMRIRTYELYRRVKDKGFEAVFQELILKLKVRHHSRDRDKPVRLALLLMAEWDKELTSLEWARQRRKELSDQIEYADGYNVPWPFFLGFITEAGGASSISRLLGGAADADQTQIAEPIAITAKRSRSEKKTDRDVRRRGAGTPKRKLKPPLAGSFSAEGSPPSRTPAKGPGARGHKEKRAPPRQPELKKPFFADEN